MRWRLPRAQFENQRGEANKNALRLGIRSGQVFGIIGYLHGQPVSWCSVGPRETFCGLSVSDLLAEVDEHPVWSVACLFISKRYRNKGLCLQLLNAAVDYAAQCGAEIVEGYPIRPKESDIRIPVAATWTGLESVFAAAGFVEAARRVEMRPIMRFHIPRAADH
jgi:GNAT superfamily N-acetyltransferase